MHSPKITVLDMELLYLLSIVVPDMIVRIPIFPELRFSILQVPDGFTEVYIKHVVKRGEEKL